MSPRKKRATKIKSKYFDNDDSHEVQPNAQASKRKGSTRPLKTGLKKTKPDQTREPNKVESNDSDSDEGDWEEVEEAPVFDPETYQPKLPESVQITLAGPSTAPKRRSAEEAAQAASRQRINRLRKENQLNLHKCSLLISIHRLRYLNSVLDKPVVRALTLSLIDLVPEGGGQLPLSRFVGRFLNWFRSHFRVSLAEDDLYYEIAQEIIDSFDAARVHYPVIMCLMVCSFLRSLGYMTRLCNLLQPLPIQPSWLVGQKKPPAEQPEPDWAQRFWLEIFDDENRKWVCYDPQQKAFDKPKAVIADKTVSYVLAIDNRAELSEVTARYAPDWTSATLWKRRLPLDGWWQEALMPMPEAESKYSEADRIEFERLLAEVPLPKNYAQYKNHRLFVLPRDLLKFQAVYPPEAPSLGFFRGEPVYSRSCVHTLRSREAWLRSARTVRLHEKPYKVVPSKFKWKKNVPDQKEMLELFGQWQTEPYQPPTAQHGLVPRNSYGNVDLYQPCMLPRGCVHLRLPGLLRIANKLNLDCVPAIVGFEGVRGGAHPVMDGFVVCREHQSILVEAWHQEQHIQQERDRERRTKRVLANWKRLIRGLIIKRNLKIKYGGQ